MKTTDRAGSRATWRSIAVAAPLAAVTFLGSVAWAATTNPSGTTVAVAQTAAVAQPVQQPVAQQVAAPAAPATKPAAPATKPAATTAPRVNAAPAVHAVTGASGA